MKLGIAVYPEKQNIEDIKIYILKAKENGFQKIFVSLLELEKENKEALLNAIKIVCNFAKNLQMDVTVDIAEYVLDKMGIAKDDWSFFEELGATTLRFDDKIDGTEEQVFKSTKFNVEINLSGSVESIDIIKQNNYPIERITASHNFYPQVFSGISYDFFEKNTKAFKDNGFKTLACVTSQNSLSVGPWPAIEGLPTLEEHRNLPIALQVKHFNATGIIDEILIGNSFALDSELNEIASIPKDRIEFSIDVDYSISEIEKEILYDKEIHWNRIDMTDYMIRSSSPVRNKYINETIIPRRLNDKKSQLVGEVYICNNDFDNYKAELQIVTKEMPYDPRKNLVGKISNDEIFLLKYITSLKKFSFKKI